MKKRIVVLCVFLMNFLFVKNVFAKEFKEERNDSAKYNIYIPLSKYQLIKNFTKITDEETPLYEITPTRTFFNGRDDYKKVVTNLDSKTLSEIFKIMYFGYGYEKQKTDSFYFATQYLIYKTFSNIDVTYVGEEKDFFEEEMNTIQKKLTEISFKLKDFNITKPTYEITDNYIVDNFIVEGDYIKVEKEKEKITIHFLEEKENYELHFMPKNKCENIEVWSAISTELLPRGNVCEKEYTIKVNYEKPVVKTEEEKPKEEEETKKEKVEEEKQDVQKKDKTEEKEETIDLSDEYIVSVPNTSKNNFSFYYGFLFLGMVYYVFKK